MTESSQADPLRAVGAAIVLHRQQAQLTTAQLARLCDLSPATLLAIEQGETEPRWGTMRRIAGALGIPLEQIAETIERLEEAGGVPDVSGTTPKDGPTGA